MPEQAKNKTNEFIKETSILGLFVIELSTFPDHRGFFHEVCRLNELAKYGVKFKPVQWSHSMSLPSVIRGVHSEQWQKIVYPVSGKIFVAIADVRPESPTFTKVEEFIFDTTNPDSPKQALFLP